MSAATTGPFARYPADAAAVLDLGDRIAQHASALSAVGRTAAGHGLRAATNDSTGLYDGIVTATRVPADDGVRLAAVSRVARFALSLWSRAIGAYDNTIDDLNAEWATAKAADFGVGVLELERGATPADVDDATSDRADEIDRARSDLWGRLIRRRDAAQARIDIVADDAASLLRNAENSNVQALAAHALAHRREMNALVQDAIYPESLRELNHRLNPNFWQAILDGVPPHWASKIANANPESIVGYGGLPDITVGDILRFVFGDPGQCVGDEASWDGCVLEAVALTPAGKWLKVTRGYRVYKHADDVSEAPPIHVGKQGKHIPGHPNYQPGKSILDADPSELARWAGSGTPVGRTPRGVAGFKENVDYGYRIGSWVDPATGEAVPTTRARIVYAKNDIHIYPIRPNP